jgi:hypothetical protein
VSRSYLDDNWGDRVIYVRDGVKGGLEPEADIVGSVTGKLLVTD